MAIKRPVVVCTLALILGEFLAFLGAPAIIFIVGVPLFLMHRIIMKKTSVFFVMIFLFLFVGFSVTKEELVTSQTAYQLSEETVIVIGEYNKCEETNYGYKYELQNVKLGKLFLRKIIVFSGNEPNMKPGNKVQLTGTINQFEEASNYGNFDSKKYYKSLGVYISIEETKVETIQEEYYLFKYEMQQLQKRITDLLERLCNDKNSGLFAICDSQKRGIFSAIITGDKSRLETDVKSLYQINGISHVLAISGLHISAIGVAVYKLLRKRFKFVLAGSISILVVIGFMFMTGEGISTARATGMFSFYLFAQIAGRKYDVVSAISYVTIMVCLQNPFILCNSAFQMSFGAIVGIMVVNPVLSDILGNGSLKYKSKKQIKENSDVKKKAELILKNGLIGLANSMVMSVSINLVLLPILAWNYFQISVYSIVLNLMVIPLMTIVISSCIVAIIMCNFVVTGAFVNIAKCSIVPGCAVLEVYEMLCNIFAEIPGNIYITGKPELIQIVMYYLIVLIMVTALKWRVNIKNKERRFREDNIPKEGRSIEIKNRRGNKVLCIARMSARIGMVIIFVVGLTMLISYRDNSELNIYFNDVGQGDCILLQKKEFVMMVDGGSSDVDEVAKYRITSLVKARGISSIDFVVVTHADYDHMSGVLEMLESSVSDRIRIQNLLLPSAMIRDENWMKLVEAAKKNETNISYIKKGDIIQSEGVSVKCIHPNADFVAKDKNSCSIVLDVRYGEFAALLTGDISSTEEKDIEEVISKNMSKKNGEKYTVLKVAHHGSKYSSSAEFLKVTSPMFSIISCGERNSYGHPHGDVVERLNEVNSRIMRTDLSGQIVMKTDGVNVKVAVEGGD